LQRALGRHNSQNSYVEGRTGKGKGISTAVPGRGGLFAKEGKVSVGLACKESTPGREGGDYRSMLSGWGFGGRIGFHPLINRKDRGLCIIKGRWFDCARVLYDVFVVRVHPELRKRGPGLKGVTIVVVLTTQLLLGKDGVQIDLEGNDKGETY